MHYALGKYSVGAKKRHLVESASRQAATRLHRDAPGARTAPDPKPKSPGGLKLHQYANLYFHARNPMMYSRKEKAAELCVLCVSLEVLRLPGVVITDKNAAEKLGRASSLHRNGACWTSIGFTRRIGATLRTNSNTTTGSPRNAPKSSCRTSWSHAFLSVLESSMNRPR